MALRSIVVTGAFGALGSVVAQLFAERGAAVTLIDMAASVPAPILASFPPPHVVKAGVSLSTLDAAQPAFESVGARAGIDVLVNVAGAFRWELLGDSALDVWQQQFDSNLKTAVIATRASLHYLLRAKDGGRVINIGAGAAAGRSVRGMGAYTAAKAGVHRFTESLADELKDQGVTVNAVLPGTIDTPANRRDMPDADTSRWVTPRQVAEVIWFLASSEARAVTGALIPVNGRA
jgi:NAD(P)-dependent dehydrogenase (short-subunit alcohol dehydrogenase family)